jgi:hypothetical protein
MKLKPFLLLLLIFILCHQALISQLSWEWENHSSIPFNDEAYDLVTDSANSTYITGILTNATEDGRAPDDTDAFIAKYDSLGNQLWFRKYGGTANDAGNAVALDPFNNPYITGYLNGKATMFLARFDPSDGSLEWEVLEGNTSGNEGKDLIIRDSIITVTGSFSIHQYTLDGIKTGLDIQSAYGVDMNAKSSIVTDSEGNYIISNGKYIEIFDPDGTPVDRHLLSVYRINSLCIDQYDRLYCTGSINNGGHIDTCYLSSAGGEDIFVCSINRDGSANWAISAGGFSIDQGLDIGINSKGELYSTGFYRQLASFDDFQTGEMGLFYEIFVIQMDPESGDILELLTAGGHGDFDKGNAIGFSPEGSVYVAGLLYHAWPGTNFGDIFVPYEENSTDAFVAKLKIPDLVGTFRGRVFRNENALPALIKLFYYADNQPMTVLYNTMTDGSGNFEFRVYNPGRYFIQASWIADSGFAKTYYGQAFRWDSAIHLNINRDTLLEGLDIHMIKVPEKSGEDTISGTVFDFDGNRKRFIDMILIDEAEALIDYTQTDTLGRYEFTGISPGRYQIMLDSAGLYMKSNYFINTLLKSRSGNHDFYIGNDSVYSSNEIYIQISAAEYSLDELNRSGTVLGNVLYYSPIIFDKLSYAIIGQTVEGAFYIDSQTGTLHLADSTLLDYKTNPVHYLQVEVRSKGNIPASDTATISVYLNPVPGPQINPAAIDLDGNCALGDLIFTMEPEYENNLAGLWFELIFESLPGAFNLDPVNGELTVLDKTLLNYDKVQEITLIVKVTEQSYRNLSDTTLITVMLNNPSGIFARGTADQDFPMIYPQPVNNILYGKLKLNGEQLLHYRIIDASGRIICTDMIETTNRLINIDVAFLNSGVYMIRFDTSGESWTEVFLKR